MPNLNVTVDDETYDEIRKSDNRSKGIREAYAELRERRQHKCPEGKTVTVEKPVVKTEVRRVFLKPTTVEGKWRWWDGKKWKLVANEDLDKL